MMTYPSIYPSPVSAYLIHKFMNMRALKLPVRAIELYQLLQKFLKEGILPVSAIWEL